MSESSDRNLLVGVVALQLDLVTRDQLIAGMLRWTQTKSEKLEQLLLELGSIDAATCKILSALVDRRLVQHAGGQVVGGRAESFDLETAQAILSQVQDSDLNASMQTVFPFNVSTVPDVESNPSLDSLDGDGLMTRMPDSLEVKKDCRYRFLRHHAKGGLGVVAVAVDEELNRNVALKEIQARYADDDGARQRFLQEAEITGNLEHPGVVPVYGLGTHADGRPYYAMRFIRGESLRDAVDRFHRGRISQTELTTAEAFEFRKLLDRFVDVCQTIEYAHSRGIVHRDIKPDNIMLAPFGETLVVDWGLAKHVGDHTSSVHAESDPLQRISGSRSAPTQMGSVVGTPGYMSPEQATGRVNAVGPQSDVYSLGATLYYLLVGTSPFDLLGRGKQSIGQLLRRVEIGDFPAPRKLRPAIASPLNAICLKAMSLDPTARYATPQALADDVQRYLADESIAAIPDPLATRIRRWTRRHQTLTTTAIAIVLLATVGLVVFSSLLSAKQKELAETNSRLTVARADAIRAANDAESRRREAESEREKAELAFQAANDAKNLTYAFSEFLIDNILAAARPKGVQGGLGIDVKVIDALQAAERKIDDVFAGMPMGEATARSGIGGTWYVLGEYGRAEVHQARVVELFKGQPHKQDQYFQALFSLALTIKKIGRLDEAIELQEQVETYFRETYSMDDHRALVAASGLAASFRDATRLDEATEMLDRVLVQTQKHWGEEHPETILATINLAEALRLGDASSRKRARSLLEAVAATSSDVLGKTHPDALYAANNLASFLLEEGDTANAVLMLSNTLGAMKTVLGVDHPETLTTQANLGKAYAQTGEVEKGLAMLYETWLSSASKLSNDHPSTLNTLDLYAYALSEAGRIDESLRRYEEVLRERVRVLGETNVETLTTMNNLALVYEQAGDLSRAVQMHRRCLELRRQVYADSDDELLLSLYNHAVCSLNAGELDEAMALSQERAEIVERVEGPHSPRTWEALEMLSSLQSLNEMHETAISTSRKMLTMMQQSLPKSDRRVVNASGTLGVNLLDAKEYQEAAEVLLETVTQNQREYSQTKDDDVGMELRSWLVYLAQAEVGAGQFERSVLHARESVQIAEDLIPDDWRVFNARSLLGEAMAGVGDPDAEKYLLDAHQALLQRQESIPNPIRMKHIHASFDRLVNFYNAKGDTENLAEWVKGKSLHDPQKVER